MTETTWNPRPNPNWGTPDIKDYYAGYSDGFHKYHFGSGHDAAQYCNPYRLGYQQGQHDKY